MTHDDWERPTAKDLLGYTPSGKEWERLCGSLERIGDPGVIKDRAVLKALGIKTGVTYSVVPVGCTQKECAYNPDCQDNAVGLTEEDMGCFMICHDYKKSLRGKESDKKVFWRRNMDVRR